MTRRTPSLSTAFQPVSSQSSQVMSEGRTDCNSVQVGAQLSGAFRSSNFFFGARFDLSDAFARELEHVADLLQCSRLTIAIETEPQGDDFTLLFSELVQRTAHAGMQPAMYQLFFRRRHGHLRECLAQFRAVHVVRAAD